MITSIIRHLITGPTKMAIIVRTDLKMGSGKIAAQCSHAAVNLYQTALNSQEKVPLKTWLATGQPKIILKVNEKPEETLQTLYEEAKKLNINTCVIYDAGKTQIASGTLTAVGLGPGKSEEIDKLTKPFKLL